MARGDAVALRVALEKARTRWKRWKVRTDGWEARPHPDFVCNVWRDETGWRFRAVRLRAASQFANVETRRWSRSIVAGVAPNPQLAKLSAIAVADAIARS